MSKNNYDKIMGQAIVNTAMVSIGLDLTVPEWQNQIIDNGLWQHCKRLIILAEKIQRKFLSGKINNTAYIVGSTNFVADVASAISFGLGAAAVLCDETDINILSVRRLPISDMSTKITTTIRYIVMYNYEDMPVSDTKFLRKFNNVMHIVFTMGSITESIQPGLQTSYPDTRAYSHQLGTRKNKATATVENADNKNCDKSNGSEDNTKPVNSVDELSRSIRLRCRVIGGKCTGIIRILSAPHRCVMIVCVMLLRRSLMKCVD